MNYTMSHQFSRMLQLCHFNHQKLCDLHTSGQQSVPPMAIFNKCAQFYACSDVKNLTFYVEIWYRHVQQDFIVLVS